MRPDDNRIQDATNSKRTRNTAVARCRADRQHLTDAALELLGAAKAGDHWVADALWEAVGPDAIEDWEDGGQERETARLADALASEDPARVGEVVTAWAVPYLNRVAGGES